MDFVHFAPLNKKLFKSNALEILQQQQQTKKNKKNISFHFSSFSWS